uniref:Phorbol-ester/DAG-type domain-containing protein n=1 Tax=Fagus sylvatica TaxID=28930 RepID=A0A2N9ESL2_FAGSY
MSPVLQKSNQINSPLHPHPLTLQQGKAFRCNACLTRYARYLPKKESPAAIELEENKNFSHIHPLQLYENLPDDHPLGCCLCTTYCSDRAYCCFECHFFLHPSCSKRELPRKMCYPFHEFHPCHPLILRDKVAKKWWRRNQLDTCIACGKDGIRYLTYACDHCRFSLHVECSNVMMSAIEFEGHAHLIHFRDNIERNQLLKCSACKYDICESYGFTCLDCDFNLHLTCGPLPLTIKHKCHMDPLVLTNSPVEEEVEDEIDEFYCHACDEKRDPLLPVYYCAKCHFVAEIKCVISKVILSLKGEYGAVELMNALGQSGKFISGNEAKEMLQKKVEQGKPKSTLCRISESSNQDVIKALSNVFMAMKTIATEEDDHYEDSQYSVDFLLSDKAYTQFMKFLDRGRRIPESWETLEEVVNVGDYKVPISMTITRVADITKDLLLNWWTSLKMLQCARFEIQFALDHLKRLTHAYFGLHVKKRVDDALNKIDGDIAKLYKDLQNLPKKIESLEKKRECIRCTESTKSNLIKECLREASVLKHRKAGTGLLKILP